MSTIFSFIADCFAASNTGGMLVLALALCGLSVVGYLCFLAGSALWAFVEDKKWEEVVCSVEKKPDYLKSYTKSRLYSTDIADDWLEHTCVRGRYFYSKVDIVWQKTLTPLHIKKLAIYTGVAAISLTAIGLMLDIFSFAPVLTSIVLSGVGLLFLARGVRRLQKKLNLHLNDKEAHKSQEE